MDLKDLLCDSGRKTVDMGAAFVGADEDRFRTMLDFALEDEDQYAMRASRVINQVALDHPHLIRPYLPGLARDLGSYKNEGLRRGLLKTISEHPLDCYDEELGLLVDLCFRWFQDSTQAPAIKVYALEILFRVSVFIPEIREELISSIENEIPRATGGVSSRSKKILNILYKERS